MWTGENIFGGKLHFENPWGFLLLIAIPVGYLVLYKFRHATMLYTVTRRFKEAGKTSFRVVLWHAIPHLWALALLFFTISATRPQAGQDIEKVYTEGIDIVIALDISSSMYAIDFKPKDRIEAAKIEAANFIEGRESDRLGLVIFASRAFPQCPLTIDHSIVLSLLEQVEVGMIEDGTAIGDALITASNRLRKSKAQSKVIILLTDGRSNAGRIEPVTASKAAAALDIKIYTIGMGKRGEALYPVKDSFGRMRYVKMDVEIDEETLRQIADCTNGKYFRATDTEKLREIYAEIDRMEKTKIEVKRFKRFSELYAMPLLIGFLLMASVITIEYLIVRQLP